MKIISRYDSDMPLALLHVPKTGGTALHIALIKATGLVNEIGGFDRTLFGSYDDFGTWSKAAADNIVFRDEKINKTAKYISGHFGFSNIQNRYPNAQIITLLREPRNRLLSLWAYWRALDGDLSAFGTYGPCLKLAQGPLIEFLADPRIAPQTDNVYARLLLWAHPLIPGDDFITPQSDELIASEALRRLQIFDQIYINENPQWPKQLGNWLHRPVEVSQENVTKPTPEGRRTSVKDEITYETNYLMNRRTRIDRQIWRAIYCKQLGTSNIQVTEDGIHRSYIDKLEQTIQGHGTFSAHREGGA